MKNCTFFFLIVAFSLSTAGFAQKDKTLRYLYNTHDNAHKTFEYLQEAEDILNKNLNSNDLLYMKKYASEANEKVRVAILLIEYAIQNAKSSAESAGGYTDCDDAASEAYLALEIFNEVKLSLIKAQEYIGNVSSSKTSKEAKSNYDLLIVRLQATKIIINRGLERINNSITQLDYC